jgi:hypothetical protein
MASSASNPVRYFGRQVRRARLAAGWTLTEFGQRTGYDAAHVSRIENGKRPATKLIAEMCDRAFPERGGWFGEFYEESRTWIATPPWFRDWVDHGSNAPRRCGTGTSPSWTDYCKPRATPASSKA